METSAPQVPVTEARSSLSTNLDIADTMAALQMLQECDLQIFGDEEFSGLSDHEFLRTLRGFWDAINTRPYSAMLLAGAGTSGRICRLVELETQRPESTVARLVFGTLPGGAQSLRTAKALGEDQFEEGKLAYGRLRNFVDGEEAIAIGVTCGLSAKYVEAFIEAARATPANMPAILGFNPEQDALIHLFQGETQPKVYLLNPIIGPEAVAGSVRMKGGSATLMILLALVSANCFSDIENSLSRYRRALELLPKLHPFLSAVADSGARSLRGRGRVFLLGEESLGALCIFDAAECVPTFSAVEGMLEGFVDGGWKDLFGVDDLADGESPWEDNVSWDQFMARRVATLSRDDTVVVLTSGSDELRLQTLLRTVSQRANVFVLSMATEPHKETSSQAASLAEHGICDRDCQIIAARILLGRLSTCIFAQTGALYENLMIDHRITNRKLLRRAVRLTSMLAPADETEALRSIAQIVYHDPLAPVPQNEQERDALVLTAASVRRVVPQAIWHIRNPHLSLEQAAASIAAEPVLRRKS